MHFRKQASSSHLWKSPVKNKIAIVSHNWSLLSTYIEGGIEQEWEGEEGEVGDMEERRRGRRDMRETGTGKERQGWERVPYWDM